MRRGANGMGDYRADPLSATVSLKFEISVITRTVVTTTMYVNDFVVVMTNTDCLLNYIIKYDKFKM